MTLRQAQSRSLRDYAIARHAKALDRVEALLMGRKSIEDEVGAFGNELTALAEGAYRARRPNIASYVSAQLKGLLSTYLHAAYIEGLAEGGVSEDEMDDADRRAIVDAYQAQASYVQGFAAAVQDAKSDADLRTAIETRIGYWAKSIQAMGTAGMASAKASEMVEFYGDDGKESCSTCTRLQGVKHRRKWWSDKGLVPGVPGNDNFECKGFGCLHGLRPVSR